MTKIYRVSVIVITFVLTACSNLHPLNKRVDEQNYTSATITRSAKENSIFDEPYRFFGDEVPEYLLKVRASGNYKEIIKHHNVPRIIGDSYNVLVLSGGGERGSYGAGVLNGLYDSGKLPDFSLVTGVSTGALTAPFAFIGGEYIHKLKQAMLALNDHDMLDKRSVLWPLYSNSLVEGTKFYQFIEKTYDDELIEAIAREYKKGKRLQIATTHFDSGRQMIWNIGRIAASDLPNKSTIIHKVLMASASIPGFFPPQYFTVYANGKKLEEMHVDGGLSHQLFFSSYGFDMQEISNVYHVKKRPRVYVIRNGYLKNSFHQVDNDILDLSARSIDNLIFSQTRGDLYKEIYLSRMAQTDTYLSYIEDDFKGKPSKELFFDKSYMRKLYDYGYHKAQTGNLWSASLEYGGPYQLNNNTK
ncbi:patatin-like phospholipase family protein [Vibrio comitans]